MTTADRPRLGRPSSARRGAARWPPTAVTHRSALVDRSSLAAGLSLPGPRGVTGATRIPSGYRPRRWDSPPRCGRFAAIPADSPDTPNRELHACSSLAPGVGPVD